MSTPTQEEIEAKDAEADTLLEQYELARTDADRDEVCRRLNLIIQDCSPSMQDRAWEMTHPSTS